MANNQPGRRFLSRLPFSRSRKNRYPAVPSEFEQSPSPQVANIPPPQPVASQISAPIVAAESSLGSQLAASPVMITTMDGVEPTAATTSSGAIELPVTHSLVRSPPRGQQASTTDPTPEECDGMWIVPGTDTEEASVDIVAVHGISGHYRLTWEDGGKVWLSDPGFLPTQVPNARIMQFGYTSGVRSDSPPTNIEMIAESLLSWLDIERDTEMTRHRPIVFIAHSLGGIIVKKALILAHERSQRYGHLGKATRGIIFLGTPHRGANHLYLGRVVDSLHEPLRHSKLLESLQKDSEMLQSISDQFVERGHTLDIRTFYEGQETNGHMIVGKDSACLRLNNELPVPIQADHLSMCKFSDNGSRKYKPVWKAVQQLTESARKTASLSVRYLDLFKPYSSGCNPCLLRDKARIRVEGTGDWLFKHTKYRDWRFGANTSGSNIFWLVGGAGSGKSFLCSSVVEKLLEESRSTSPAATLPTVCFFFCKESQVGQNDAQAIICGLLFQIFKAKPFLIKHLGAKCTPDGESRSLPTDIETLCIIFRDVIRDPKAGSIVCVVDAVDECEQTTEAKRDLKQVVKTFSTSSESTDKQPKLKVMISSRPAPIIKQALERNPNMMLGGGNDCGMEADVRLVIKKALSDFRIEHGVKRETVDKIEDLLLENAQRTFLWVSNVLRTLEDSTSFSEEALINKVKDLPKKMDKVYESFLQKIPDEDRKAARLALVILAGARRPLKFRELNLAMVIRSTDTSISELDKRAEPDMEATITKLCGSLVRIVNSRVFLAHKTVKDFLVHPQPDADLLGNDVDLGRHCVSTADLDLIISGLCIRYLCFHNNPFRGTPSGSGFQLDEFLDYSAVHWAHHYRAAQNYGTFGLVDEVVRLCDPQTPAFAAWIGRYRETEDDMSLVQNSGLTALMVASHFGLTRVVERLLDSGVEVDAMDSMCNTAMMFAIQRGHSSVVMLLGAAGAGYECRQGNGWTPLVQAIQEHNEQLARQLVNDGAEVDAQDRNRKTPIHFAASRGMTSLVRLLIEKGADINAVHNTGLSALDRAAMSGHLTTVQLLLDLGATISNRGHDGRLPLHWAAFEGYPDIVKCLVKAMLQNGIDIFTKDDRQHTPLYYAKKNRHHLVIEILELHLPRLPGRMPNPREDDPQDSDDDEPEKPYDCVAEFEALLQARVDAHMRYENLTRNEQKSPDNDTIRKAMEGFNRHEIKEQIDLWDAHRRTKPQRPLMGRKTADLSETLKRQRIENELRPKLSEQVYDRRRKFQAERQELLAQIQASSRPVPSAGHQLGSGSSSSSSLEHDHSGDARSDHSRQSENSADAEEPMTKIPKLMALEPKTSRRDVESQPKTKIQKLRALLSRTSRRDAGNQSLAKIRKRIDVVPGTGRRDTKSQAMTRIQKLMASVPETSRQDVGSPEGGRGMDGLAMEGSEGHVLGGGQAPSSSSKRQAPSDGAGSEHQAERGWYGTGAAGRTLGE